MAAGGYLLHRALPRQRDDPDAVLAVGVLQLLCAAALVGIGRAAAPIGTTAPGTAV